MKKILPIIILLSLVSVAGCGKTADEEGNPAISTAESQTDVATFNSEATKSSELISKLDPAACSSITNNRLHILCNDLIYEKLAVKNNDKNLCDKAVDVESKTNCLSHF